MHRVLSLVLLLGLAAISPVASSQTESTGTANTRKKASGPTVAQQLAELKQAIEAQQQQIAELDKKVQSRDQRIQQLEQRLDQNQAALTQAQAKADSAASQTAEQVKTVATLSSDVTDLKANSTGMAVNLQETQKSMKEQAESPTAIHFKGVTITPGGFLAAESVYRNRGLGADINTPFNSVNMPGAGQNALSEFYGSGRQSRISLLAEGSADGVKMAGYYEADLLSSAITSNNNQSNSYSLRQRQ